MWSVTYDDCVSRVGCLVVLWVMLLAGFGDVTGMISLGLYELG